MKSACVFVLFFTLALFRVVTQETQGMKDENEWMNGEKALAILVTRSILGKFTQTDSLNWFQATKYFNARWSTVQLMIELINDDAPPNETVRNKIE